MVRLMLCTAIVGAAAAFPLGCAARDDGGASSMRDSNTPRYFMANAWADWISTTDEMQTFVDAWTSRGLNGCGIQVPWVQIEPERGRFNWQWLDERLDIIADAELKVHLRLSTHSHRPEWVDAELMRDPAGKVVGAGHWTMLAFADPRTGEYVADTLREIMAHVADRYGGVGASPAACVMAQFSGPAETEYAHDRWSDFSEPAQAEFRAWLERKHASIEELNRCWGTRHADWAQVSLQAAHTYDFNAYRSDSLASLLKRCADAVHTVPDAAFCVQFGSIWDGISVLRGNRDARAVIEHADWVVVDDYPLYDHAFSMDYLRGHARDKVWGNEIDGPGIVPDERGLEQCMTSLGRGARVLWAANWRAKDIANTEQWSFWEKVMEELGRPARNVRPDRAIALSLATIYRQDVDAGVDGLVRDIYARLTNNSRDAIDIFTDSVALDHPEWLTQYTGGIFIPATQKWMTDELFQSLSTVGVPVYVEDEGAGDYDEYGRPRTVDAPRWAPIPLDAFP